MSLTAIKPYFKARCTAVGLTLHPEAFDVNNIPSTVIDKSFQIGFTDAVGTRLNQSDREIDANITITFFIKSYANTDLGMDKAIEKAEALIQEVEAPANRLGGLLKNVLMTNLAFEPMTFNNDNIVRVKLIFTVKTILAL